MIRRAASAISSSLNFNFGLEKSMSFSLCMGMCHFLGKDVIFGRLLIGEVKDIIHFPAGNDQRMAFHQGVDVEKSIELVVFSAFIGGNLSCCYF